MKWFDKADACFAEMMYSDAVKHLDKAVTLDDSSCKYFSSRAAAHAAVQDWDKMMEDAQTTIDLVDRYEGGLITQDELISLHNFKNLAETFYQPPAWLAGQLRQYELREKDEQIAKQAEAALETPRSVRVSVSVSVSGSGSSSGSGLLRPSSVTRRPFVPPSQASDMPLCPHRRPVR